MACADSSRYEEPSGPLQPPGRDESALGGTEGGQIGMAVTAQPTSQVYPRQYNFTLLPLS